MPSTKPFRSATWARTLFAKNRSALSPALFSSRASRSVKKSLMRRDALRVGGAGRAVGGVDAENRNVVLLKNAQHIAVVARGLDDEARGSEALAGNQILRAVREVLHQRGRDRREIRIGAAEQNARIDGLSDLHERARRAEEHVERNDVLGFAQLLGRRKRVGERRGSEGENGPEPALSARTAGGDVRVDCGGFAGELSLQQRAPPFANALSSQRSPSSTRPASIRLCSFAIRL